MHVIAISSYTCLKWVYIYIRQQTVPSFFYRADGNTHGNLLKEKATHKHEFN